VLKHQCKINSLQSIDLVHNDQSLLCMGICGRQLPFEILASAKQCFLHHWLFTKVHNDPQFACSVQNHIFIWFCYKTIQATGKSHATSWKCQYLQHWPKQGSTNKV